MSLNLPINQTGFFAEDMTDDSYKGILKNLAVRKMAFSDEVLQQKLNSDIINLPGKKVLVMHYNDFHPVKLLDLKTVSSKVKKILIKDGKFKLAKSLANQLKNSTGLEAKAIMEKYNWNFSSLQKVDQSNTKISKKLLLAIFNTSTTKGLSPKEQPYEYIKLSGNKIAVYQLQSIDNVSIIKKSKKRKI